MALPVTVMIPPAMAVLQLKTCTQMQVGRLRAALPLPTSGRSREACEPQSEWGVPY